jgi:RNA polymerase sigma-70 factor (ECF subfamily)
VGDKAARIYCVVPWELAEELHEELRLHFGSDPSVEVVVERRRRERRAGEPRRQAEVESLDERRAIRNAEGRRVGDRRAAVASIESPMLPERVRAYAGQITFVERLEPSDQHHEDLDTARLVTRFQAGDREVFSELYMRYFDRVYSYLRLALDDEHAAEDTTQQVFLKVMEALPRYERRTQPFRAWLFTIVRNHALRYLEKRGRMEVVDPVELTDRRPDPVGPEPAEALGALGWISDRELLMLIERLPVAQRQVLMLRYMMDLTTTDIATILGRSGEDVRALQSRALRFLQQRLTALGRAPQGRQPTIQMTRRRAGQPVLRARRFEHHP